MAFNLFLKRSSVPGKVPLVSQLGLGEISVNTNDGLIYFVKNVAGANSIVAIGPSPLTANALTTARTISLSGDTTGTVSFDGSANVSIATTLANSGVTAGTYNSVVVNAKGLVTAASATASPLLTVTGDVSGTQVGNSVALTLATVNGNTGTFNTLTVNAKGQVTAASNAPYLQTFAVTGDATGTSTANTVAITLATVNANVGTFGSATSVPTFTINAKGLTTAAANIAIAFPVTTVFGRAGAVSLLSTDVTTALGYTPISNAAIGAVNGVASLDGAGRLPASQLPASIVGALVYQGTWNASTNTPTLASGTGTKGFYYKVATAGSTTIDGLNQWNVGDSIVFDGTTWDKIDGIANEVLSVAGRNGAVVLTASDVAGVATLVSPAFTGVPTAPTPAVADSSTTLATTAFVKSQNYMIAPLVASGDVSGTAVGNTVTMTLATVNSTVGTYAGLVLNAKGLVTSATALTTLAAYGIVNDTIDGGTY